MSEWYVPLLTTGHCHFWNLDWYLAVATLLFKKMTCYTVEMMLCKGLLLQDDLQNTISTFISGAAKHGYNDYN